VFINKCLFLFILQKREDEKLAKAAKKAKSPSTPSKRLPREKPNELKKHGSGIAALAAAAAKKAEDDANMSLVASGIPHSMLFVNSLSGDNEYVENQETKSSVIDNEVKSSILSNGGREAGSEHTPTARGSIAAIASRVAAGRSHTAQNDETTNADNKSSTIGVSSMTAAAALNKQSVKTNLVLRPRLAE
jgi:hypothetical protein